MRNHVLTNGNGSPVKNLLIKKLLIFKFSLNFLPLHKCSVCFLGASRAARCPQLGFTPMSCLVPAHRLQPTAAVVMGSQDAQTLETLQPRGGGEAKGWPSGGAAPRPRWGPADHVPPVRWGMVALVGATEQGVLHARGGRRGSFAAPSVSGPRSPGSTNDKMQIGYKLLFFQLLFCLPSSASGRTTGAALGSPAHKKAHSPRSVCR